MLDRKLTHEPRMTAMTIERDVMVPARDGVPLAAGGVLLWIVVPLVAAGSGAMA